MTKNASRRRVSVLAVAGFLSAALPGAAQTVNPEAPAAALPAARVLLGGVNFTPLANDTVAPPYPQSVPNGGQPLPTIRAMTGFGRLFGFGASSIDTRQADGNINQTAFSVFTEVATNSHAVSIEVLSPLIGAENRRGSSFPPATNFAEGGATSAALLGGFPTGCVLLVTCTREPQIDQFEEVYGRYDANDVVLYSGAGVNDWGGGGFNNQAIVNARTAESIASQTEAIRQNIELGARTHIVIGPYDVTTFSAFNTFSNNPGLLSQGVIAANAGVMQNLIAFHRDTGVNIHYFDTILLIDQIRANPTAYGFSAAGVAPFVQCTTHAPEMFGKACSEATFAEQNSFLSLDGIHLTYRYHEILAAALTNQMLAPYGIAVGAEQVQVVAATFNRSLVARLDAFRWNQPDDRGRVSLTGQSGLFVQGSIADGESDSRIGEAGFEYEVSGLTVGFENQGANVLLGFAGNYSLSKAQLVEALGESDGTSGQAALYVSINAGRWFGDISVQGGHTSLDIERPGVIDTLSASPSGLSVDGIFNTGFLFEVGAGMMGPVAGFEYTRVRMDDYSETGDSLLTQQASVQNLEDLRASVGAQIVFPFLLGTGRIKPHLTLTAEHHVLDRARTLTTAQTYAPELTIDTEVTSPGSATYGRVRGGVAIRVGNRLAVTVDGETTFARDDGQHFAASAGIRIGL